MSLRFSRLVQFQKRWKPFVGLSESVTHPQLTRWKPKRSFTTNCVEPSKAAMRTRNLIREIVDQLDMSKVPKDKELISLGIGDPSVYPHLRPPFEVSNAVECASASSKFNSYQPAVGLLTAREAVARIHSLGQSTRPQCTAEDVWMACGCSHAVELSMCALLDPSDDDLVLLPKPGFPLYQTICMRHGLRSEFYRLREDRDWEIDVAHLRQTLERNCGKVKAIVVNSPSNPCGSVLSRANVEQLLAVCEKHNVTVISDEIYAGLVYCGSFTSVAAVASGRNVPVLTLGGLAKLYLVPGWRLGWIVAHDTHCGKLRKVREALFKLTSVILGPAAIVQAAVPSILSDTPASYYASLNETIRKQSMALTKTFSECVGLKPVKPKGAMYVMVGIDTDKLPFKDDVDFANRLLEEEALLVLPGSIFGMPHFFRVVTCAPVDVIQEIDIRIKRFCKRHAAMAKL